MATTGKIGPNAEVRVDGKGEHDLGTFNWTVTKTKEPFVQIGKQVADRYTVGPKLITWDGEATCGPDGKFRVDWDGICSNDLVIPLVFSTAGRTERLLGACVDEAGNAYQREDGRWVKSVSGKAFDHQVD
jgi:hypothetical protein